MRRLILLVAGLALLAGVAATVSGGGTQTQTGWVIRDLGTLGGDGSSALDISDHGQVVGFSYTRAKDAIGNEKYHAFLWKNGKMLDLGTLGGEDSEATGVNNHGQVVGWADTRTRTKDRDGDQIAHAFLWEQGRMRDLGTLGGPLSAAYDINDRGEIVGRADPKATNFANPDHGHAFLWRTGKMIGPASG